MGILAPGRIRDSVARSESVGSTRYSRDPRQPGRSESASLIRVARVSRFDPNQSRSESAVSIRVSQLDPSRLAPFEPVQTHPCPCPLQSLASPSYVPAMMATGRRSTTSRGSEATEPSLGAGAGAGAGGALSHPRGAAVRRGFNSSGRPRVVLG